MYAVVIFREDNTTSEVPVTWLTENNTQCWWPIKIKNPSTLMEKIVQPANDGKWKKFDVTIESYCSKFPFKNYIYYLKINKF